MNGSIPTKKGKVGKLRLGHFHFFLLSVHPLPSTPCWMFGEEGPKIVFQRFCDKLQQLEEEMEERNMNLRA